MFTLSRRYTNDKYIYPLIPKFLKYAKLKGKINNSTIIVRRLHNPISIMYTTTKSKNQGGNRTFLKHKAVPNLCFSFHI